jgi:hypothetical protein
MLNEARMSASEVGEGLRLHTVSLQAVSPTLKVVPLLPNDVVTDEVARVHRHALQLTSVPVAHFFN